ncbi:hypothetical protein RchiOBHm_Chr7g0235231 [Rosa chinensis]|uniref:Uncharacterized protein n=1 Tax=Rosa chinensis TaxID=74649 RepID=A0A2P6PGM8_ROSCH|nr:hypothetical protein RchiOBHm_Chr7g0235231 [Rosa chinensis]
MGFNCQILICKKRVMEDRSRTGLHDVTRASRKAKESAWRRAGHGSGLVR